jgi:hypothetical protein
MVIDKIKSRPWTWTLTKTCKDGFENLVLGQSGERSDGVARKGVAGLVPGPGSGRSKRMLKNYCAPAWVGMVCVMGRAGRGL